MQNPAAKPPKHVYSPILYQRINILHRSDPKLDLEGRRSLSDQAEANYREVGRRHIQRAALMLR
jgi:hypothetical protein